MKKEESVGKPQNPEEMKEGVKYRTFTPIGNRIYELTERFDVAWIVIKSFTYVSLILASILVILYFLQSHTFYTLSFSLGAMTFCIFKILNLRR